MSGIDPWALPQGGLSGAGAGIPGTVPVAPRAKIRPLGKRVPILVMALSAVYVVALVVDVFIISSQISLINQLQSAIESGTLTADQVTQVNDSDTHITEGGLVAGLVYIVIMVGIIAWQARLKKTFGSVGAARAVLKRAGYAYFRAVWLGSFALGFLVVASTDTQAENVQGVIDHDHLLMVYCAVRAVLGVVLIFFAFRLKKTSEEAVARLSGAYA
jgi:hypothetical protein